MIGPHQQDNAYDRMLHVGKVKHHSSRNAEDDRKHCYYIGVHPEPVEEQSPRITDGAVEMNVKKLFCIHRLERSLKSFLFCAHLYLLFSLEMIRL